jgi:hypothetical protein
MLSSDLKLKFAQYFLTQILEFDEGEFSEPISIESSTTIESYYDSDKRTSTNTALILERLNCFIECYFFTAMSSLDAIIYEIVDEIPKTEKPQRPKITNFSNTNTNSKTKIFINNFKNQYKDVFDCIYKFVNNDDFKKFNEYRNTVAHKSILKKEFSFETIETLDNKSYSKLKRPILLPEIIDGKLSIESNDLEIYLKDINNKIMDFHKNIKLIIN